MKQRILAEGNDIHVILQVCIKHGLNRPKGFLSKKDFEDNFAFKSKKGEPLCKQELIGRVPELLLEADLQSFGIVLDADDSVASTWQSVKDTLKNAGYSNLPAAPDANGTIITDSNPDLPKVGIWIMPDNQSSGEIEDFFLQLIDSESFHLRYAREVIDNMIVQKQKLFADSDRSKAEVHTWLAWQKEPDWTMGVAVGKNWASAKPPLAKRFAAWFSRLFELEEREENDKASQI
jgi:hypothetical protein